MKVGVVGLVGADFHGQVRAAQVQVFGRGSRNVELDIAGGRKRETRLHRRVPSIEDRGRHPGNREKIERRVDGVGGVLVTSVLREPYPLSSVREC